MAGNTLGTLFRVTTCGESHGGIVAAIVDGCPAQLELTQADIQKELDRRKPGQSRLTSPRKEADIIHIESGVFEGKTTGTPILLMAYNQDVRSEDYEAFKDIYRPSHADYTYQMKYGIRDFRGSGRASARETLARVAAGAIAKKYLKHYLGVNIFSYVEQVGSIRMPMNYQDIFQEEIDKNDVRCPHAPTAKCMMELIEAIQKEGDSIGGVIRGVIQNVPPGLGEPVFDKLPADLAKAMLSINAAKGFDMGSGFEGVSLKGSQHNDLFFLHDGAIKTQTNHAGGTLGGISNGAALYFRVAFKAVATIAKEQQTVNKLGQPVSLKVTGRHDACVLPRAVPIVDAMAALVLMDHYLRHRSNQ